MNFQGAERILNGGEFHLGTGWPQGRGIPQKCNSRGRVSAAGEFQPRRGPGRGCGQGLHYEEQRGDLEEDCIHRCGHCCRHGEIEKIRDQTGNRGISKFEVEFLDRLQELELQTRIIRGENLEQKKIITRLYNLTYTTHTEMKAQQMKITEKVENIEETPDLAYPHKAQKRNISDKEMESINRKMKKLQSFRKIKKLQNFMDTAGNFVDLSMEKNGATSSVGAAMERGPQ